MLEKLKLLIQSGNPIISIETTDEQRACELIGRVTEELSRPLNMWSMTRGLRDVNNGIVSDAVLVAGGKALPALEHIQQHSPRSVYLFQDLGPHCKDAHVHRTIRDLIPQLTESNSTLVMVDALPLPDEIRRFVVRFEIGWPDAAELEEVAKNTFRRIRNESLTEVSSDIKRREMEQLVQSLRGLSAADAQRVVASAIYDDFSLTAEDFPRIVESKRTLLGNAGCLESIGADIRLEDVGGLDNLKSWLKQRRGCYSRKAREFGLEPPRGMLMLGVPGCGKSLCAKAVASDWNMPLLRLDPGVLYQKFIGESESQLRQALAQAEAMAPLVLWIDEIEKAFASASASSADGGLSKRMFGTLLSWMQDHRHPIFIIATANDISALPPELMRKGRFDEVFFVDLPNSDAREIVLGIHLKRKKREPADFNLKALAEAAEGFSGAELEQAVIGSLFRAYQAGKPLADEHILEEIGNTRPLSVLSAESVAELRAWAENRCVPAD